MSEYRRHRKSKKLIDAEKRQGVELQEDEFDRHFLPLDEICGYKVRPGLYNLYGATMLPGGINFTIYSNGATSMTLLLYHRKEKEPFATIPFPESYRIGKVYSMIVFDLDIENLEYCYSVDGPWEPEKGLLFDKNNLLLDPFAKAVSGQRIWGESFMSGTYRARVVWLQSCWLQSCWLQSCWLQSCWLLYIKGFIYTV